MKKVFVIMVVMAAVMMSCQKNTMIVEDGTPVDVGFNFQKYEVAPMRDGSTLTDIVSKIDLYIVDITNPNDYDTIEIHQVKSDNPDIFGNISVTLQSNRNYTLHALAHKFNGDVEFDGTRFTFPTNENFRVALYASMNFSPATSTNITVPMQYIVAMFKMSIDDTDENIPDNIHHMQFTIVEMGVKYNINGYTEDRQTRTATISGMSRDSNGYINLNVYITGNTLNEVNYVTVSADAMTEDNTIIKHKSFNTVPVRDGFVTRYYGTFFTDANTGFGFECNEWGSMSNEPF